MIEGANFGIDQLRRRTRQITVCVPARDEVASIGRTVAALVGLRDEGALDRVLVVGGDSTDGTDELAREAGADVLDAADVHPEAGPVLGKGDAMWRALAVVDTDVVVFLDADLAADHAALVAGLAGPLLEQRGVRFVKGAFHREHPDFVEEEHPFDGGRVTELMARPLVNLLRPDLAGFYQPLGGQVAADTALLRELPLFTGYAVEIGMLVDVIDRVGLAAVAEVNLGALRNRPRPTAELAPMAQEVLYGFLLRVAPEVLTSGWQPYRRPRYEGGYDEAAARVVERPPLASLV